MTIQGMLDTLSEYQARRILLEQARQQMRDAVITPEIQAQLQEIEDEMAPQLAAIDEVIASQEASIKAEVITTGASVKGAHLQAVYTKGRVSWDTKIIEGLAVVFPDLEKARKIGDPSVSIRKVA